MAGWKNILSEEQSKETDKEFDKELKETRIKLIDCLCIAFYTCFHLHFSLCTTRFFYLILSFITYIISYLI